MTGINNTNGDNVTNEPTIIDHHTHYLEIHGYDKTVEMTRSEHQLLHIRLRKTGKCNIPVDELRKISNAAHQRGDKCKAWAKKQHVALRYEAKSRNEAEISECEFCWEHFGDEMLDEIAKHEDKINAKARDRRAAKKLEAQS